MARKGMDDEELLSFAPKRRNEEEINDWDFLDDEEEELDTSILDEELPEDNYVERPITDDEIQLDEEPIVEEEPVVEEEPIIEEEPVEEVLEEDIVEDAPEEVEAVEEQLDEVELEEVEDAIETVEEDVDEVEIEEVEEEPEVVEEMELDDIELEESEFDDSTLIVPVVEDEEDEDDGYDRTNIFQHATVYYDQNTTILPRNFESRIRMASPEVKKLYSDIKNVLMEYSNVKSRMLKYVEVFRCGGAVAKMRIKGKSLYLYLKLDPTCVDQDYLKVVDKSERRGYEETPAEIKVTGKRKCKRSIEMIRLMMDALGVGHRRHPENVDYAAKYPTIDNAVIAGKNMVRVSKRSDYVK